MKMKHNTKLQTKLRRWHNTGECWKIKQRDLYIIRLHLYQFYLYENKTGISTTTEHLES